MKSSTAKLSREETAKREIGQTDISRRAALFLTSVFVMTIFGAPLLHHVAEWRKRDVTVDRASWGIVSAFSDAGSATRSALSDGASFAQALFKGNAELMERMHGFEEQLDNGFMMSRLSRPWVQAFMCRLGVGNEEVIVARDGWLFYEPGLNYVTGPGFLNPQQLAKRGRSGTEWSRVIQPDPIIGILHFRDQLREHGVELVVMPVPVKPSIHPEFLTRRIHSAGTPIQNASYAEFIKQLALHNVHVFDCASLLQIGKQRGAPMYLKTDTHWRPEAVQATAHHLAAFLTQRGLASYGTETLRHREREVTHQGDLSAMLDLALTEGLYPKETVAIAQVVDVDGHPWQPFRESEILLLGDSFANIYSMTDMGWGEAAGLAEQLSFALRQPVDTLIRNDAGAHATRGMLSVALAGGSNRLVGKRVVVWEFSARELAIGDWKLIDLDLNAQPTRTQPGSAPTDEWVIVSCDVSDISERPVRNAVYKDFVMKLFVERLVDISGEPFGDGDGVIHIFGMRNRIVLPIAGIQKGARLRLRIRPWEDVEKKYGAFRSGMLEEEMLELEKTLYWAEPTTKEL